MTEPIPPAVWAHVPPVASIEQVPSRDPALAYLASLSPKGRQTMTERLRTEAALFAAEGDSIHARPRHWGTHSGHTGGR